MAEISALTQEQLCYFSRQFSNMFGLPVRLYRKQACVYTYLPVQLAERLLSEIFFPKCIALLGGQTAFGIL